MQNILRTVTSWIALAPTLIAAPQQIIPVASQPDDGLDDTLAIANAFAAVGTGPATIQFSPGTYDLFLDVAPQGFELSGKQGIRLEGQGATLKLHGYDPMVAPGTPGAYPKALFAFEDVAGLELDGFSVEMTRPHYSWGEIVSKGTSGFPPLEINWIKLRMEEPYSDLGTGFQIQRINDVSSTGVLEGSYFTVSLQANEYSIFDVSTQGSLPEFTLTDTFDSPTWFQSRLAVASIGDHLLLNHSKYRHHFMRVEQCADLVLSDVLIKDMPGMGLLAKNVQNVTLDNFDAHPSAGRLMSLAADGAHLNECTGTVQMTGCDMEKMGDDGLNVHGNYLTVVNNPCRVPGLNPGYQVDLVTNSAFLKLQWQAGDIIEFRNTDLTEIATTTLLEVLSVGPCGPNAAEISVKIPVSSPLPIQGCFATNLSRVPDSVTVSNCSVNDNIANGLVLKCNNGLIEDCVFRRNTGPGVKLTVDANQFFESKGADTIVVQNCTFESNNQFIRSMRGALSIAASLPGNNGPVTSDAYLHRNIQLLGNTFSCLENATAFDKAAIWVGSADSVYIQSNQFCNIASDLNLIRAENSTNVVIGGGNCGSGFSGTLVYVNNADVQQPVAWPVCPGTCPTCPF